MRSTPLIPTMPATTAPAVACAVIVAGVALCGLAVAAGDESIIGQPVTMEGGSGPNGPFGPGYGIMNFGSGGPAIVGPALVVDDAAEFTEWGPVPMIVDVGDDTISYDFVQNISFSATFEYSGFVFRFPNLPDRGVVITSATLLGQTEIEPPIDELLVQGNALAINLSGRSLSDGATLDLAFTYELVPLTPGDINGDGVIDGADLGLFLAAWGSANFAADINGDGVVDGADLGLLLASWTLK